MHKSPAPFSIKTQFCAYLAQNKPNSCGLEPSSASWAPNGCSNPLPGSGTWNSVFNSACNTHDTCYNYALGSKNACDSEFKTNMEISCLQDPNMAFDYKLRTVCMGKAKNYHTAVQTFGGLWYDNAQKMSQCDGWHELRKKYCNG